MEKEIYQIIKQTTGFLDINSETSLLENGIDSLQFIMLIIAIEEEFDIRFEDMQLIHDNYGTVDQLVSVVKQTIVKQKKERV